MAKPVLPPLGWDEAETQVDLGDLEVGPDDPTKLSVGIPALSPGTYTVRYRVLSADGHVVESQLFFRIQETQ
jgi:methionine-rich copper-binding protein CopC